MPRDGANIYTQPFPDVASDTTIESVVYNGFTSDVANDLNAPRPILAGGTGGATADAALTNLSAEKSLQVVTNYNSMVWMPGSFYSASSATGAPVAGHAFVGLVYLSDSNNIVLEAHDQNDISVPGRRYVREKKAGAWSAWIPDGRFGIGGVDGFGSDVADMSFGLSGTAPSSLFFVNTESDVSGINALEVSKAGDVTVRDTSGHGYLFLNKSSGATGKISGLWGQTNGLTRWSMRIGDDTSESGADAGSNFALHAYNDAGIFSKTPLHISRATGLGVVSGNPIDALGIATKQYVDGIAYLTTRLVTGAASITIADWGKTILVELSSAATISVAAVATLTDGFWCQLVNVGTAIANVDGSGAETIDGHTVRTLGLGDSWKLFSNTAVLRTSARKGDFVELTRAAAASNKIDINFATGFPADFDEFELHLNGMIPSADDSFAYLRVKTTGSLTVQSGGGAYNFGGTITGPTGHAGYGSSTGSTISTLVALSSQNTGQGAGNAVGEFFNGIVKLYNPNDTTSYYDAFQWNSYNAGPDSIARSYTGAGMYGSAVAITGLEIGFQVVTTFAASNVSSGTGVLYGIRK